jgi:hypothetical protein
MSSARGCAALAGLALLGLVLIDSTRIGFISDAAPTSQ